jgi:hypothetical protein
MVMDVLRFIVQKINPEEFLAAQPMDVTITPALEPLIETVRPLLLKMSVVVGGVFGLYLIVVITRIYYERKKVKLLKAIRYDLDVMNEHNHIPSSRQRDGLVKKLVKTIRKKEKKKKSSKK